MRIDKLTTQFQNALADAIKKIHDEWPRFRQQALADATTATDRHAPATYAAQITRIVDSVG